MLNVETVLTRLKIDHTSRCGAVQDVRTLIEDSADPVGAAKAIIQHLTSDTSIIVDDPMKSNDTTILRMFAQRLVDQAILMGDSYDSDSALRAAAKRIAEDQIKNPWFFMKDGGSTVVTTTEVREGVNVEVKTDGKIKKGGKQILAQALYEKHKALDNKAIIEIFMKELDMSKPGATTYLYNCKKGVKS